MVCYRCQRPDHVSICVDCRTHFERLAAEIGRLKRDLDFVNRKLRSARCDQKRAAQKMADRDKK